MSTRSLVLSGGLLCVLIVVAMLGHRPGHLDAPELLEEKTPSPASVGGGGSSERKKTLESLPNQLSELPEQPCEERNPAPESPSEVDMLPQTAEELLDDLARQAGLTDVAVLSARQAISGAARASQQPARAARQTADVAERQARAYDFTANPAAAANIRNRLAKTLMEILPAETTDTLLVMMSQAAESDPSVDFLERHRCIVILPREDGDDWQVLDRTFSSEGNLVAAKTVLLGLDEDGQFVWPEEYQLLLSE